MTFPVALPHGALTEVADGVHCVRGSFPMGPGIKIGRTMTVLRGDDGLVVLNAVRLSDSAQQELDALGPVKHLVKLSDSHFIDEPFYADRYELTVWTLPGAELRDLRPGKTLGDEHPIKAGVVIDFGAAQGWREAAYWVPHGGGTLVTCDAIQNHVDNEGSNFIGGLMAGLMGFKGGVAVPPMWRKFQKLKGAAVAEALAGLTEHTYANLVTGHGPHIAGGADAKVKAAIERAST
ncbi:MAG: hypothetical protein OEM63_12435 [Gammaproteobacteria bacterium]|nr:hypothetical protein [Gammaproteobacteria bacterium]